MFTIDFGNHKDTAGLPRAKSSLIIVGRWDNLIEDVARYVSWTLNKIMLVFGDIKYKVFDKIHTLIIDYHITLVTDNLKSR